MKTFLMWIMRGLLVLVALVLLALLAAHLYIKTQVAWMPGDSFSGPAPVADAAHTERARRLRAHVDALAFERHFHQPESLQRALAYIDSAYRALGYEPQFHRYTLGGEEIRGIIAALNERRPGRKPFRAYAGGDQVFTNLYVTVEGTQHPEELLVIGGHYDTVEASPGAYDNAAAVASVLEIARHLRDHPPAVSVMLVAFTCEEYPMGGPGHSGSDHFADWLLSDRAARGLPAPMGMISLDTLGNFRDEVGSQVYPFPLNYYYPDRGNFVGLVGESTSRDFIRECARLFREVAQIPSEGVTIPSGVLDDVLRSDHAPFVARGVPGLMFTDTANFRVPNPYHTPGDTPEKIDYLQLAQVANGVAHIASSLDPLSR